MEAPLRDALKALTALHQDTILLDYANVVIRRNYEISSNVRLLSGGADLGPALFVGKGLLTAAILGDGVAPTSRQILRTLKELSLGENSGILVILQGDLFNFGLAEQRMRDCRARLKSVNIDKGSGAFALTVKILGAMGEQGFFFDELCKAYSDIDSNMLTVQNLDFSLIKEIKDPVVILIDLPVMLKLLELTIIKQVIEKFKESTSVLRVYSGNFGASTVNVTALKVPDVKVLEFLDAPSQAPGWQQCKQFLPEVSFSEHPGVLQKRGTETIPLKGPKLGDRQVRILTKAVGFACEALTSCERQLNTFDHDGNVGYRLSNFCEHLSKRLVKLPLNCPYAFLKKLSIVAEECIGGTLGSIYGIFFESGATAFADVADDEVVTSRMWAEALSRGCREVAMVCTPDKADNCVCYPLKCAEGVIYNEYEKSADYLCCFGRGVSAAEEGAQRTKQGQYPDPGAHAVGIWMRAVFEGVKLMDSSSICDEAS